MKNSYSIRISDFLTGKNIWKYYKLYTKTQWFSSDEMKAFQLEKFKKLIIHCYENVPFYKKYFKELNIDPYIINDFSILSQFPIIDKKTVLLNYNEFIPKNIKSLKRVKSRQTSGTTGQILKILSDSTSRSSVWATFERFYDWIGKNSKTKVINLKGAHVVKKSFYDLIKNKLLAFIENKYILNAYDLTDKKVEYYYHWLKKLKNPILRGYAQNIYDLASLFKEKNYRFNFKSITTTAEPLMLFHRLLFKEIFNCETFDQYGCGEVGGVAYECDKHEGLHVSEEKVIVEVSENNDLILTDLDNFAFPLIRYKNGDQAVISQKRCSCGRKSLLLKELLGRTSDNVYGPNGNLLHWGFFHHLLIDSEIAVKRNMKKFQVIQKTINELDFLIVSEELTEKDNDVLKSSIQKVLGQMTVNIKIVRDIPSLKSGKYKAIISKI